MQIIQKGNKYTNSSSRDGHIPIMIVDHISGGSMGSMDNWFQSSGNEVSSAHFGVSKAGAIHQYVDIQRMAWGNGLVAADTRKAPSALVKEMAPVNPNKYSVSIEHEGTDGMLTEAQYAATVWLHTFISNEVERLYGKPITLDRKHIVGHFQIDPIRKPYCPGPKFPWARLYGDLKAKEGFEVKATKAKVTVNGQKLKADALLIDGTTYIPLRAVTEALGAEIGWDNITKTASVTK
ncbi:N-acetylmuramoyl-L-alanine amidase [Paenibacillus donghaensis]|uniref:N-acetylmuramoyl-L-alanine amidase n=1 Tax=Paenibacillus donghaensis TaxID=414771 RepID=A0A2Z2KTX8_9BACL|nr:N-acetylmuramoyl-L-alanine amidase [Paenibacillus donghaensis]ASA25432.1 hypothetical protein B9T62_34690 [Paenibacillus donghaensis]